MLTSILHRFDHLLIAFSGGVDSTCLLAKAVQTLGTDRVLALTATSPTLPEFERQEAVQLAKQIGVRHILRESGEMQKPAFVANGADRCYHCKNALFDLCESVVLEQSEPGRWSIAYGANLDDLGDDRPGMIAAQERSIHAPLLEAEWGKETIRAASKRLGLPTWDKAAFACLSSRFPRSVPITTLQLHRVEQAEDVLRKAGFHLFRVRCHKQLARIEIAVEEMERLESNALRQRILRDIKQVGFHAVMIDPGGYQTGGANKA